MTKALMTQPDSVFMAENISMGTPQSLFKGLDRNARDFFIGLNGSFSDEFKLYIDAHDTQRQDVLEKLMKKHNYKPKDVIEQQKTMLNNSKIGNRMILLSLIAGIFKINLDPSSGFDGVKKKLKEEHNKINDFDEKFFDLWGISNTLTRRRIRSTAIMNAYQYFLQPVSEPYSSGSDEFSAVSLALGMKYRSSYCGIPIDADQVTQQAILKEKSSLLISNTASYLAFQTGYDVKEMAGDITDNLEASLNELSDLVRNVF